MTPKEIHFYYDLPLYDDDPLYKEYILTTYEGTKRYIDWNIHNIHTTSLANLNLDLLDKGYKIYLHQNNKELEVKLECLKIQRSHNILNLWLAGNFHNYFYNKN